MSRVMFWGRPRAAAHGSKVSGSGTTTATRLGCRLSPYTKACATRGDRVYTFSIFSGDMYSPCGLNRIFSAYQRAIKFQLPNRTRHQYDLAQHSTTTAFGATLADLSQLEDVLLPVDDLQAAAFQPHAHIPRVQPAVCI